MQANMKASPLRGLVGSRVGLNSSSAVHCA